MAGERILIVEDEGILAADLESMLSKMGFQVVGTVPTGEEAVEKATALHPDLVLMDIRLKGTMDGIDAAEQITVQLNVPVTYLTAFADKKTLGRAKATLPYGYILKPFTERDLRTAVELALYKHKMESMTASLEGWHATALRSIPKAVVATDALGRITFMNDRAEALLNVSLKDVYGKDLNPLLEKSTADFTQSVSSPIKDDNGRVAGSVIILEEPTKSTKPSQN